MDLNETRKKLKTVVPQEYTPLIYQYLLDGIIKMDFPPGTLINEAKLAEELEVSRTPVHGAVDRLVSDHLIRKEKNRNAKVQPLFAEDYNDLIDFRKAIEGEAAALAAKNITRAELDSLKETLDMMRIDHTKNQTLLPDSDTLFHEIILSASRSAYFSRAYQLYRPRLLRYRWFLYTYGHCSDETARFRFNQHAGIYNALKSRMSSAAKDEVISDIQTMRDTIHLLQLPTRS